jgi:hypothetical protein
MTPASTDLVPAGQMAPDHPDPESQRSKAVPCLTHPSPRRAASMIALAWLPALVIAGGLPRFVPTFERWPVELPPLTEALMAVGRLGLGPIALAGVVLVAVMAAIGFGWVRAGLPCRRAVVFALAAAGLGAFVAGMAGTLGPILTAPVIR